MKLRTHAKILFIALAAAVTATAAQAEENYTLYGKARASVDITDNGEASASNVSSNSSRFGFKGNEDLGNGLRAIFQMETLVTIDGSATDGLLFGTPRNSYIGLAGGFGTLALGVTDNAYKLATSKLDIWSDSMGDFNAIIGNVSGASTPFNEREPSSINYWSPKMSGFQLLAAYRLDEDATVERDKYSVAGVYENGPYYAALAYESHENEATSAGNISTGTRIYDTNAWTLGLGYTFNQDKTKVNFVYESLSQDDEATLLDRNAWYLALAHKMDSNTVKIAYARAGDNDAASNTGANWYVVGLDHALSKRTALYALYARSDNDTGARYGLGTGGSTGNVTLVAAGANPSTFSIGINHDF